MAICGAIMELKDLIGEHILDAVDFSTEQVKNLWDDFCDSQVIRFRLDGKVFTAIEDPDDGYRSCMKELFVGDWPMSNAFPPVRVLCRHKDHNEDGEVSDILELIDAITGEAIVQVGTEEIDGYYPSFVAVFRPEAMAINNPKPSP